MGALGGIRAVAGNLKGDAMKYSEMTLRDLRDEVVKRKLGFPGTALFLARREQLTQILETGVTTLPPKKVHVCAHCGKGHSIRRCPDILWKLGLRLK